MFQFDIYMYFKLFLFNKYFVQTDFMNKKEEIQKIGIFQVKAQ